MLLTSCDFARRSYFWYKCQLTTYCFMVFTFCALWQMFEWHDLKRHVAAPLHRMLMQWKLPNVHFGSCNLLEFLIPPITDCVVLPQDLMNFKLSAHRTHCSKEENWVYAKNGQLFIKRNAIRKHGMIRCTAQAVQSSPSNYLNESKTTEFTTSLHMASDFAKVSCSAEDGGKYFNFHASIVRASRNLSSNYIPENVTQASLYIIAMDGFSLMTFKHEMKKTYRYITDTLNGIVYYSFAMTNRNTTLSTLLTGELGEDSPASAENSRTNFPLPLLWNYMQEQNYTMMFDGGAEMGNEVWDIFLSSPGYEQFEHGMTAFRFAVNEELNRRANRHCFGSESEHNVQFSYAQEFFTSYSKEKPKFAFQFLPISSSNAETSLPEQADEDMVKHLKFLNDNGILKDTMIVILSSRGSTRRQSGKNGEATIEQYKPLLVVILPSTPAVINRDHAVNYKINEWSLVTPADVYITLLTLPIVNEEKLLNSLLKNYSAKGTSLFKQLSTHRTCAKAGVAEDLCPCLNWIHLSNATNLASLMAKTIVLAINRKTAHERALCAFIHLKEIVGITMGSSNGFNHSVDEIMRLWSESDDPVERYEVFQVAIATRPGNSIYKAWIILDKKDLLLHVDLKNVYRLNGYGLNPECIVAKDTTLIDWCVCYDKVNG